MPLGSTAQVLNALGHASLLTTGSVMVAAGSAIAWLRFFPDEVPQRARAWAEEAIVRKPCMAQLQGELAREVFQAVTLTPMDEDLSARAPEDSEALSQLT